jgi:hypothetical protein
MAFAMASGQAQVSLAPFAFCTQQAADFNVVAGHHLVDVGLGNSQLFGIDQAPT